MGPYVRSGWTNKKAKKLKHDSNFTGTAAAAHEAAFASPVPAAGGVPQISNL